MRQLDELRKMDNVCKQFTEWSQSELEADMWIDIHNKVIRTIDYYEQLRESSTKSQKAKSREKNKMVKFTIRT